MTMTIDQLIQEFEEAVEDYRIYDRPGAMERAKRLNKELLEALEMLEKTF
jgi:predicted alternative tryptophan synthase beta-subunit